MKYTVKFTAKFKRDYKQASKRGLNMQLLKDVVSALSEGKTLPAKNQEHALKGEWEGYWECHILPDWLLVYRIEEDVLILTLTRTGSHADLFRQ